MTTATDYEQKYHGLMESLIKSRWKHGTCKRRFACTACMAQRRLEAEIAAYRGRKVRLAGSDPTESA